MSLVNVGGGWTIYMDNEDLTWVRVADDGEIAEDAAISRDVAGLAVCLARSGGRLYAIRDQCTHADVPLSEGEVEDGTVECFMHGSRFNLATGRVLNPPAVEDVATFPLRTEGSDVFVALPPQQ